MQPSEWLIAVFCGPCICAWVCVEACFCPSRLRRHNCGPTPKEKFVKRQQCAPRPHVRRERPLTIPVPRTPRGSRETTRTAGGENEKERRESAVRDKTLVSGGQGAVKEDSETERAPMEEKWKRKQKQKQKTYDQLQSPFFKLPPELRDKVYMYLWGGDVFHIIRKERKIGHLRCKARDVEDCPEPWRQGSGMEYRDSCWGPKGMRRGEISWTGKRSKRGNGDVELSDGDILPLLRSCRRIYSEAIPTVYKTTTFSFADLDNLRYLTSQLPTHRLSIITSLRLEWHLQHLLYSPSSENLPQDLQNLPLSVHPRLWPPDDEATWEEAWRIIAGMSGLKELRVRLSGYEWLWAGDAHQEKTLKPLWQVHQVEKEKFVVCVPWYGECTWARDAPFRVLDPEYEVANGWLTA